MKGLSRLSDAAGKSRLKAFGLAVFSALTAFVIGGLVLEAQRGYSAALITVARAQQKQDAGHLRGLLSLGASVERVIETERISEPGGILLVVDARGGLLASSATPADEGAAAELALASARLNAGSFGSALDASVVVDVELSAAGENYLAALANWRDAGGRELLLVYASPESAVLAPVRETTRHMLVIGFSALAFAVITVWFILNWISAPIVEINRAVGELASGNLKVSVTERRIGEIGRLTRHFNEMTSVLRETVESLAVSEKKQRALLDALPDLMFVNSRDGTYLDFHANDISRLAMPPEKFMGRKLADILPPELAAPWQALIERAIDTGRMQTYEYDMTMQQGGVRRYESRTIPYGQDMALTISRDITELRASERRLLHLASAVEQAADSIIITDPVGRITYVNPSFSRISGIPAADALGAPIPLLEGEKSNPSFARWRKIPADERPTWQGRLVNRFRDRDVIQEVSIAPIRDDGGKLIGYVSAQRDMTRETELEASVSQARRLESLGRLAGGIAHDFNNMLVAIAGYTDLCLRRNTDPQVGEDLHAVKRAASRAKDLVRQIMAFGRMGYREDRPLRPGGVVEEVLNLLRSTMPPDIETLVRIEEDPVILADPTDLHRVISNLVANAIFAMRRGGGILLLRVEAVEVDGDICAANPNLRPGRHCRITVADTGGGMTPEVLERAFEPFYSNRGRGEAASTGMGLAVAHGLVTAMHGAITAKSRAGEGATFEIHLPLVDREVDGGIDADETPVRGTERVLFVDDDEQVVELARKSLPQYGYTVTPARSAEEALALFSRNRDAVDAVVADMHMGGLDGLEMASRMLTARPGLPIIIVTGQGNRENALAAKAKGVAEFVIKPVSMEYLTILLRRACDRPRGTGA